MMRFVSLGGDCQPAHHIRRINPQAEKHFFDWLIVPARAIIGILDADFADFAREGALKPVRHDSGELHHVEDERYGALMLHDYEEYDAQNIARVNEKYTYLAGKFLRLREGDVTFIRQVHPYDGDGADAETERLYDRMIRFNPSASLVYLHQDQTRADRSVDTFHSYYLNKDGPDWTGDQASWDQVFEKISRDRVRMSCSRSLMIRRKCSETESGTAVSS